MRARLVFILPFVAAVGMVVGGGDAKAITIRYDFDPASEAASGYTGGTINVGSLDQALGAAAVQFTVETGSGTFTLLSNYAGGNTSNELLFSRLVSSDPVKFESWEAKFFNFGSVTDATTWRQILSTN
jgi:hypothetical protein